MTHTPQSNIEEFLKVIIGSKEVGLMIAQDSVELERFYGNLDEAGFKRAEGISDFFRFPKVYSVIDGNINKDIYDFVVQYPTGQVEIFDQKLSSSNVFSPDYENSAVVLIALKDDIGKLEKNGFDLLSVVGPAFQS